MHYTKNQSSNIVVWIIFGFVLIAAGFYYLLDKQGLLQNSTEDAKYCTMDVMQCPDGSYVSRTGPNCEFAKCPGENAAGELDTSNWKTYRNEKYGFEVRYPMEWTVKNFSENSVSIEAINRDGQEYTLGYIQIVKGMEDLKSDSLKAVGWTMEKEENDFNAQNLQGVKFTAVSDRFDQTKYAYIFPFSDNETLNIDYIITDTEISNKEINMRDINQVFDLLAHSLRKF